MIVGKKIFPGIWKQTIGKPQRTLTGIAGSSPVPTLQEKSDAPIPAKTFFADKFSQVYLKKHLRTVYSIWVRHLQLPPDKVLPYCQKSNNRSKGGLKK